MKKIFFASALCLFILHMAGCSENEKFYYDPDRAALNIWLGEYNYPTERETYNFAYRNDGDSVMFYARLSGLPVDYDRPFELIAVEGDTDKVDYYFPQGGYVLPAGEYEVRLPIYFEKPDGYDEFTEEDGSLVFKMKPNSYFEEGIVGRDSLRLVFKNGVTKPDNWDYDEGYPIYSALSNYFGSYSDTKFVLMIQVMGMTEFRIKIQGTVEEDEVNVISYIIANYWVNELKKALEEYEEENGRPLEDEFGQVVTFD